MANLRKIVYLTEAQKAELFSQGSVTSNGTTITYSANDLYVTPDKSIDTIYMNGSVKTVVNGSVDLGTVLTPASGKANNSIIAPVESSSTASQLYNVGDLFIYNDQLYKATSTIATSTSITPNTNCESISVISYIENKADKVNNATNGNFAALDANGNLTDSGHKHSDYLTSHQDISGKADKTDTVLLTTLSRGRQENTTVGTGSFAFGLAVTASGNYSHAEGLTTTASGGYSHTEGNGSVASGNYSHAEGMATASGDQAHAEGISVASGSSSHAEGYGNASSMASHAEGIGHANGMFSHAEGNGSSANGLASHVEGYGTVADGAYSHVIGSYNVNLNSGTSSGNKGTHVEIIGNGTADDARSNAYALTWTGDGRYAGDVYVGCSTDSSGGSKLAKLADIPSVTGKADKVASATNGNFAALDSNGNLTDSGHKHSDYLASNTTYVSSVNGSSGAITIGTLPTVSSSDNGKVLRVVSGVWTAVSLPSASGVSF